MNEATPQNFGFTALKTLMETLCFKFTLPTPLVDFSFSSFSCFSFYPWICHRHPYLQPVEQVFARLGLFSFQPVGPGFDLVEIPHPQPLHGQCH